MRRLASTQKTCKQRWQFPVDVISQDNFESLLRSAIKFSKWCKLKSVLGNLVIHKVCILEAIELFLWIIQQKSKEKLKKLDLAYIFFTCIGLQVKRLDDIEGPRWSFLAVTLFSMKYHIFGKYKMLDCTKYASTEFDILKLTGFHPWVKSPIGILVEKNMPIQLVKTIRIRDAGIDVYNMSPKRRLNHYIKMHQ